MVLSGKERQARYLQRLKDAAAGVTPEMVIQAGRIMYREVQQQNDEPEDWAGYLASCHNNRGGSDWREILPDDIHPDAYDWVEDADDRALLDKFAAVMHAVNLAPKE